MKEQEELYVGIDWGSRQHQVCVTNGKASRCHVMTFIDFSIEMQGWTKTKSWPS